MIRVNRELLDYVSGISSKADHIAEQQVAPGEEIIPQGKRTFNVYVIKSGLAKCYISEDNGKDFIQEFFGEGELFGEIEALKDTPSFCCIEAITYTEVFKIRNEDFLHLLEADRAFNKIIMKALADKISYKAPRHAYHQSHSTEENLLRLLDTLPELTQKISKQDIANYLGITLRSLNRSLNTIKQRAYEK